MAPSVTDPKFCLLDPSDEEKVSRNSWNRMTGSLMAADLSITGITGIIIFIFKCPNEEEVRIKP